MTEVENLIENGLKIDTINNLDVACNILYEPPVRIVDTYIKNAKIGAYTFSEVDIFKT